MTLANINHDSGPPVTDHWDTTDTRYSITVAAALNGTVEGLQIDYNANAQHIRKAFVASTQKLILTFYFDPNGITAPGITDRTLLYFGVCQLIYTTDRGSFTVTKKTGGDISVTMRYGDDIGGHAAGAAFTITDASHLFKIEMNRASSDVASDGSVIHSVDGVVKNTQSNVDNYDVFPTVDNVFCYAGSWDPTMVADSIYVDEVLVEDVAALSLAAMTKPAAVDAAGGYIYVALLQGTPIVTKIAANLSADGVTVFNPGAGDNIGVECGRFNSDVVWVAGNFDGTNVIEKSEDGGSTFTVKDNGAIGDVRTFVMGPDSDDRLLIFDETNGDILETRNGGGSWKTINASVTPEINAIARLGKNVQESVFGNDGAANNSINYSVNSGDDLQDYQTGVYPNANATGLIVN